MRLIDADALKEKFTSKFILDRIEQHPTAVVILHDEPYPYRQPVKNKWRKRIDIVPVLECPECECRVLATDYSYAVGNRGYSFCPYCGADLREERR